MRTTKSAELRTRRINADIENEALQSGFTPLQARVLAARLPEQAKGRVATYALPRLSDLDAPWSLPDIEVAVEVVIAAIEDPDRKIICLVDHDADGVDSLAVLVSSLVEVLGVARDRVIPMLSHRLKEGYGVSDLVIERLFELCPEPALIITADQGSTDEPRFARLVERRHVVVVTDHHEVPEEGPPPSAVACVNPSRKDSQYPDRYIAGCYVAWLLMAAVRSRMIERGLLSKQAPPLTPYLDFVAIGTTADAASFSRSINNRAVVRHGIGQINRSIRPAWRAMRAILRKTGEFDSSDIAMGIAPRLNARGRLGDMMLGADFLLSSSVSEAIRLASDLDEENNRRKAIEKEMVLAGLADASSQCHEAAIVVHLRDGHPGVHGIVATRYMERFGRPVVCLSPKAGFPGILTGSLRGVAGTNVREALATVKARLKTSPISYGGHAAASGCLVREEDVDAFRAAFQKAIAEQVVDVDAMVPVVLNDGSLGEDPAADILMEIEALGPYGREFELPSFVDEFFVQSSRPIGDGSHLKMMVSTNSGRTFEAIWFRALEPGTEQPVHAGETVNLHYRLSWNDYRGIRKLNLVVQGVKR